jgi:hypothetical protein
MELQHQLLCDGRQRERGGDGGNQWLGDVHGGFLLTV